MTAGRRPIHRELNRARRVGARMGKIGILTLGVLSLAALAAGLERDRDSPCGQPGQWLAADTAQVLAADSLLARLAGQRVVLLGERHDSAADHRWQLHTLAALHGRQPRLALGFEMFPRRLQPVLDDWVAGKLSEAEFLKRVEWDKVWGYDAGHYLPLFHFARMHRLPMLALNVERALVAEVEARGWEAAAETLKAGLTRPAPPSPAYLAELADIYRHHPNNKGEAGLARFAEAQTVWDRALAEGIAAQLRRQPDGLVVGILGAGHVRHGHGVAHQLADLGVDRVSQLLTWPEDQACHDLKPGLADAVFVLAPEPAAGKPPRLGIAMNAHPDGVLVAEVLAASVAEAAGLKSGDLLLKAAGRQVKDMGDVRGVIERQAPGTWLPLTVRRDSRELELVARFPAE